MNTIANKNSMFKFFTVLILLISLSACSTLKPSDDPSRQTSKDPYRGYNRAMHSFNTTTDKALIRPIARGYKYTVPAGVRKSVSLFFSNLGEPLNAVNNLLQGDIHNALGSTYRFVVNSTLGGLGLFDVAGHYGVKRDQEDFGQTLAAWGVNPGPYIVLPFLGPSNLRDGFGRIIDTAAYYPGDVITDSGGGNAAYTALDLLSSRTNFLNFDKVLESQPDPYLFLKIGYENNRLKSIYDGDPPVDENDDIDDF